MKLKIVLGLAGLLLIASACKQPQNGRPVVVATTSLLGDAVRVLLKGTDSVAVTSLMGPGVDPHLYKASQGDIAQLSKAELIVFNGLHLEGKMNTIFSKLKNKRLFEAGKAVNPAKLINATQFGGAHDPHIWFDPMLWKEVIVGLSQSLSETFPEHGALINENLRIYLVKLNNLHQNSILLLDNIPERQRVLVTAHDAFKYFGRAYSIKVVGLQGISTTAEYGIKDVSNLVKLIVDQQIKAVFIESSIPKRSIEAVIEGARSQGHAVRLGGELYSDALGDSESEADSYLGMFQQNVLTISDALR
jgi:manganese/zinc/iron transport system substrate-binding protein